jgi:hypothetical protein
VTSGVRLRAGLSPIRRSTPPGSVRMIENGSNSEIGPTNLEIWRIHDDGIKVLYRFAIIEQHPLR